ncbi:hypothetical protein SAMN05421812_117145 [Asanoa hainanensis]|uniref:DUF5666 domain-containing protein n=1 Tax=Asanoa hainanensis TaxID=560556 RepID=A0A239PDB9_9ACTN|nr:hypothetical protein [Asanoa hainanensis]SNT64624.1 hypothetical protein SAMN05421812_117145 [Asanoa hainanensis]
MTTLDAQLAATASRRWWNRWTVVLALALLLVGGFASGIQVQKAYGDQPAAGPGGGGFRGQGGFTPPTAFPGGGSARGGNAGAASETTTGTVKLVDGTTVYVETESGDVVTVRTDADTAVSLPGKLKDLKAGDKVSVSGGADGSTPATAVAKSK